jgi:hypothetical protein
LPFWRITCGGFFDRCVENPVGTLSSLIRFFRAAHSASHPLTVVLVWPEHKNRLAYTGRNRDYGINESPDTQNTVL